ncbi:MAG: ATP-binding cassette subfamily B protein RaxB [Pseudohongiellaceae bacterium]|jgi:ATP-binding cassette subfamily B protein RaxB
MNGLFAPRYSLPMIFQSETSECGLACIAMISSYLGRKTGLGELREIFKLSLAGASVKDLMMVTERIGLRCRPLKVEIGDLAHLQLPIILHWDLDHFVVLKRISKHTLVLHDPAVGVRSYSTSEVGVHFTGVAIEVSKAQEFVAASVQRKFTLRQLFEPGVGFYKVMAQVFVMSILIQLLSILTPLYLQLVIDQGLSLRDEDLVLLLSALFILVMLAKTVIAYFRSILLLQFSNQFGFQLAASTFHHLIRLPLRFFEKREMGDIVSRFSALESIKQLVTQEMITVVVDGIFSLVTLVLLYLYSPFLSGLALVGIVLFCILRSVSIAKEKTLREEALVAGAKQQTSFMENIRSISTTKINGIEQEREHEWLSSYTSFINSAYHLGSFQLSISTMQGLVFGIDHILTIYFGAMLVFEQSLTIGQLMSFIFLKAHFIGSVTAMVPKLAELKLMSLELERLSDITLHEREFGKMHDSLLELSSIANLSVKGLSFRYAENLPNVFSNVNCELDAGESLGVWGKSGCGKSTFLKLLLNFENANSGGVLFGGRALATFSMKERREYLAAILHGETLLAGSLAYNINLNLEKFDDYKLMEVCELVGIADVVRALPMGFSTQIGELGMLFSAGQVQRLLLARALYYKPKILLLDEALSHLSEAIALDLLTMIRRSNITLILVSHSPALLRTTDKQLMLDEVPLAVHA